MATLYIIATPIGNLEDMTYRAVRILNNLEVLACEDTRTTRNLLNKYEIKAPEKMFSYHEHNEKRAGSKIIEALNNDQDVGICSDAGLPCISDPGFRAVQEAIKENHKIEVLPGPSSVQTALVLSGLPTSSYTFKGFSPRKSGQRQNFLRPEKDLPHSVVLFESKYRIVALLKDAYEVYGDRLAAVCIEITKKFEKVFRGYLKDLISDLEGKTIKGEITVVIAGNNNKFIRNEAE